MYNKLNLLHVRLSTRDVLILKKSLLGLVGFILIIVAITLYRLHYIDSGIVMIMCIIAGLSVGAIFSYNKKK